MYSTIYWITRLDNIRVFFIILLILSLVSAIIISIWSADNASDDDDYDNVEERKKLRQRIGRVVKPGIITAVISSLLLVFIPSQEEAILIYAGGKAYDYVQKDTSLQKIPFKTTEYLRLVLDKEINELKKK